MVLAACLALAGCGSGADTGTIDVSIVGNSPRIGDPDRVVLSPSSAELARATRQGLVAFDATGQVEPALAESWTFTKDGLSVIFRLRSLRWPDGKQVTGRDVAASLNRARAAKSRNPLRPLLSSIEGIVAMTDRVVEIRLRVPRPNLLQLLAQPELGIRRDGVGTGPWRAKSRPGGGWTLEPRRNPDELIDPDDADAPPVTVVLRGERAALAITRFMDRRGGFVTGGTVADWPVVQVAQLRPAQIRIEMVEGLFGLAVNPQRTFMKDEDRRRALAMAIDRDALVKAFGVPGWQPIDRLLPTKLDSAAPPASPDWSRTPLPERRTEARNQIAAWTETRGPLAPVRVALPPGPGMTILFARLAADWRTIGVGAIRVPLAARDADVRLVDAIAPNSSANWYLTRTGCDAGLPCSRDGDLALKASRAAPDLTRRAAELANADAAAARHFAFIPLARPFRWSLVDPALTGFRENAFAVHPLATLRPQRN